MAVEALAIINPDDRSRTGLVAAGIAAAALYAYHKAAVAPGAKMETCFSWVSKILAGMVVGYYGFEHLTKERLQENAANRYFVKVVGERVVYPQEGSEYFPRGYPLRKAQDFARIGSQTGKPRKVLRGGPQGRQVRTYRKGRRAWPVTAAQAKTLTPAERPRQFR